MSMVPPTVIVSPPPTPQIIVGDAPGPQGPPGSLAPLADTLPANILTAGTAGAAGVANAASRSDHSHPIVGVGTLAGANAWTGGQTFTPASTTSSAVLVQALPAQSGALQQWKDSSGNLLGEYTSTGLLRQWGPTGPTLEYATRVLGDTQPRFSVAADGTLAWGSGNGATDATLSRLSAGVLGIGGSVLQVNSTTGTLGIGGAPSGGVLLTLATALHPSAAATVWGTWSNFIVPSTATTNVHYYFSAPRTQAAGFTAGAISGFTAAGATVIGAGSTVTTMRGFWAQNQGQAGVTNAYGVWIDAQSGASNNNFPLVVAGLTTWSVNSSGQMGLLIAPQSNYIVAIGAGTGVHPTGSTSGYGIVNDFVAAAGQTSSSTAYHGRTRTAAAAFTLGTGRVFVADNPVVGAGSSITTQYGLYVTNQGNANITNSYGIWLEATTGSATNNLALVVNSASQFSISGDGKQVGLLGALSSTSAAFVIGTGTLVSTAVNTDAILVNCTFPTTATTTAYGIRTALRLTAGGAYGTVSGYRAQAPAPNTATVSSSSGIQIENHGFANASSAYGLFVFGQSGASTTNVGIAIQASTTCALWLSQGANTTDVTGGILFGSSKDVNLYRGAGPALQSDSNVVFKSNAGTQLTLSAPSSGPWALSIDRSDLTNASTRIYAPLAGQLSFNQYDTVAAGFIETLRLLVENSGSAMSLIKQTAAAANPGATRGKLYFRDGTNVNTLKLVVRAGAAGAETTVLDNIPT